MRKYLPFIAGALLLGSLAYSQALKRLQEIVTFPLAPGVATCGTNAAPEGTVTFVMRSGLTPSRACVCIRDGIGADRWVNILSNANGTSTVCPAL